MKGRWILLPGAASLLGAAMMTAALLPTFVSQGCAGCSAFLVEGLPDATLRMSPDAWAIVWIIGIICATAVLRMAGIAARLTASLNAVTSVVGLCLAIFEGVAAFPRILGAGELVPGGLAYVLGPGYYLLLIGGVVAFGAAIAMILLSRERFGADRPSLVSRRQVTSALGWACLASLVLAAVGAFLPFATLNCGFGCPALVPHPGSASAAIVGSAAGWVVLILVLAAGIATAVRLAGRQRRPASSLALLFSLAATALVSLDSLNGGALILGWPFALPVAPEAGYYVMQAATALSTVLSFVLVAADGAIQGLTRRGGFRAQEATHLA